MPLRLRRGTDSSRTGITPIQGEPIYTTDTKKFFIGDGTTPGGVEIGGTTVSNSGDNRIITSDGTSTGLVAESNLSFDGSTLTVTGNIYATAFSGSLTGSLTGSGTGSWTGSFSGRLSGSLVGSFTGSAIADVTGSFSGSFTGSIEGSSSYATSASFALSSPAVYDFGSFATPTDVGGGGNFGIVTDGDKGDITVTSSGSIWTIDNDVVTYSKIQNATSSSILLGRATPAIGNIEEISLGSGLTLSGSTLSAAGGGGGLQFQIEQYTSSGTWTKPSWAKKVTVLCVAGGCGGGSGRRCATTAARAGGSGGQSHGMHTMIFDASQLSSSVSYTVGAGGAGGASVTVNDTNGNPGFAGGYSSFGSYIRFGIASSGGGGGTTSNGSATFSSGVSGPLFTFWGFGGGSRGETGTTPTPTSPSTNNWQITGGCGGAGQAANVTTTVNGGAGGSTDGTYFYQSSTAGGSGGTDGGNASNGNTFTYAPLGIILGTGGGGGSYKTGQATGNGGNGVYGAGGGGGAASDNGFNSGAGGNGGDGFIVIITEG